MTHLEQAFARKLLHIPGPDQRDIDNEVRAIMKLCRKGHKNIVSVLKFGELPNSAYYFIDMELCDLNLGTYIHRIEPPNPLESLPYFIKDASADLRTMQIANIMSQVAGGIKYIHGHDLVHRDVKPANGMYLFSQTETDNCIVLYSRKDSVWKLADFGITSEGTARRARATTGGRGTPGYRAPELMSDTANGVYNNKVDIWSMGCILHELALGTKVFNSDWAVIQHQLAGKDLEIKLNDTFGDQYGEELSRNINLMLRIEPQRRPSAADIFATFTSLCGSIEGFSLDNGETEMSEEAYTLQEKEAETKEEECRRIDAIIKGWKDTSVDILAERYEDGRTAIHMAAREGDIDKIKALKKLGADFKLARDKFGGTPIFSAASRGHVEAISLLNKLGVPLSAKDNNGYGAVHIAASWGQVDAIKALKDLGADLSTKGVDGVTPIHHAALYGQSACIAALQGLGADVSVRDDSGRTPMHCAASGGHVSVIRMLKELGADVSGKAIVGITPMHSAARAGQLEAIQELKTLGVDLSEMCGFGYTPMHYAAMDGRVGSIKKLKELGADLSATRASDGWSPLHVAAAFGHLDCIRTLHELGADMYVKATTGLPVDLARAYSQKLAVAVLLALA